MREPIPLSSAEQTMYAHAQSANQPVTVYKLSPSFDAGFLNGANQVQMAPQPASLIQLPNTIPQQQLPDTYALPISNQPQLQQVVGHSWHHFFPPDILLKELRE